MANLSGSVFRLPSRGSGGFGGGYQQSSMPYANLYGASMAELDIEEKRAAIDLAEATAQRQREKDERDAIRLDLAQQIEARKQRMAEQELDFKMRAQDRADRIEARRLAREDQKQELLDRADEFSFKLESLNPMNKDSAKAIDQLRKSADFNFLMSNRDTRQAVAESLKNKIGQISEITQGIQHEGRSKYGVDVDISKFPTDDQGNYDFDRGYNEYLPMLGEQMKQISESAYQQAPVRPGYEKYQELDEFGRPVAKFTKAAPLPKPEDIKKGFQQTYGASVEALSQPYGTKLVKGGISVNRGIFEDGEFKPLETGDIVQVIDASKGMNKKVIHNIPYDQFESYRSKVQGQEKPSQIISAPDGIEVSSPIGIQATPSSLPSATPQVTTEEQPARKPLGEIF